MASSSLLSPLSHADSQSEVSHVSSFSVRVKVKQGHLITIIFICDTMLMEQLIQRLGTD